MRALCLIVLTSSVASYALGSQTPLGTLRITAGPSLPALNQIQFEKLQVAYFDFGANEWEQDNVSIAFLTQKDFDTLCDLRTGLMDDPDDSLYWSHKNLSLIEKFKGKVVVEPNGPWKRQLGWECSQLGPSLKPQMDHVKRFYGIQGLSSAHFPRRIQLGKGTKEVGFYFRIHIGVPWSVAFDEWRLEQTSIRLFDASLGHNEDLVQELERIFLQQSNYSTAMQVSAELRSEPNSYGQAFDLVFVQVLFRVIAPLVYFYIVWLAVKSLLTRKREKIATPLPVKLVLVLSIVSMSILGVVLAVDGYNIAGNLPDYVTLPFRQMFIGLHIASNLLVADVWKGISGQLKKRKSKMSPRIKAAIAVALVDLLSMVCLGTFIGGILMWVVVPFFLIVLDLSNSLYFLKTAIAMLTSIQQMQSEIESSFRSAEKQDSYNRIKAFRKKTTQRVFILATCSLVFLVPLISIGMKVIFFDSPEGNLTINGVVVFVKAAVVYTQVAICSPPPKTPTGGSSKKSFGSSIRSSFKRKSNASVRPDSKVGTGGSSSFKTNTSSTT